MEKKKTIRKVKKTTSTSHSKGEIVVANFDLKGAKKGTVSIPSEFGKKKAKEALLSQLVRVHQINTRQGTQSTKTRGEVIGSTRKIYRQKGTGRARHGSLKAPIFVGGGVALGPKPRVFEAKVSKKMRSLALFSLISEKAKAGDISTVSGLTAASGKTKEMMQLLTKIGSTEKTLLVLVKDMEKARQAARNFSSVDVVEVASLSAWDVMTHLKIVMAKEALEALSNKA